jgi:1-acyl-sn-glycerol-3-phosphate acyltransferase
MPLRRFISIPAVVITWLLLIATSPIWLIAAAITDLVRRNRGVALRSAGVLTTFLTCEVMGIVASGALFVWKIAARVNDERWTDVHFRLETWWGTTIFRAIVALFGLRVEVEDDADLEQGPYLLLVRHSSSGDTLLASAIVSQPHGMRLRYILKKEHLWDPCLDIVGNRVPNAFVDRAAGDPAAEIEALKALTHELGPRDGILIYPEGTRFSESKRRRVLDALEQKGDPKLVEYARSLHSVLPPKPGGTLGILQAAPSLDVIVCAHTGFEGAGSLLEVWKGALIDRVIRVHFRRVRRSDIPTTREAQTEWLREEWRSVDAWVESHS